VTKPTGRAIAAWLLVMTAAGCGASNTAGGGSPSGSPSTSSSPTSVAIPQAELLANFVAEEDPMRVLPGHDSTVP
jgi:hypothetical protein